MLGVLKHEKSQHSGGNGLTFSISMRFQWDLKISKFLVSKSIVFSTRKVAELTEGGCFYRNVDPNHEL